MAHSDTTGKRKGAKVNTSTERAGDRGVGHVGAWKVLFAALVAFVVAASAVAALMGAVGAGSFTPRDEGLLQPGNQAPEVRAKAVGSDDAVSEVPIAGGEQEGPTLLMFFATWCPYCNEEAPLIAELAEQNEDLNVVMAGIDGKDDPQKIERFVREYDIEGRALYEPSLGETYQVTGYPTVYVIDGSGEIVGANSGKTPKSVLEDWIAQAKS